MENILQHNVTLNHVVRILMYEIRDKNPDSINFVISPKNVETIAKNLIEKRYDKLISMYGMNFVNEILKMHEEYENYEECSIIVTKINKNKNDQSKLKKFKKRTR